jgi:uncharacterized membrane protein
METLLVATAHGVEQVLDLLAIAVVAVGAIEAFVDICRWPRSDSSYARRTWLRFAHWLIAALTFELAADIVATTIAPSWDDLGKLASIAVIRTFLTFFLDRDLAKETSTAASP